MNKPSLSLCMIVKNESDMLAKCLESVKDVVDEMIIVDTGSTDQTKEIAASFGAKLFDYTWNHDFASARNFAKEQATSEWILQLDADEYVSETSKAMLKEEIDYAIEYALTVQLMNYDDTTNSYTIHRYPRIYRNIPEIQYEKKIHEQLMYEGEGLDHQDTAIQIIHLGYTSEVVKKKNKIARNIRIIREELRENPNDAFMNFNLANELMKTKEYKKAIASYQTAHKNTTNFMVRSASVTQLIKALTQTKQYDEVFAILSEAKEIYTDYTDLWFLEGEILEKVGREQEAKESYQMCLTKGEASRNYLTVSGIGTVYPIEKLAEIAIKNRDFEQALGFLTEVTEQNKYSMYHVTMIIGLLLRLFEKQKVVEFIDETYISSNKKDVKFKNQLAHHFRLYEAFADSIKEGKEQFSQEDQNIIDFYVGIHEPKTKQTALDFAKYPATRHFAFVYYLLTQNEEVKEAVSIDKTCRLIASFLSDPRSVDTRKINYKKDIYIEIIKELMKIEAYEKVENMLALIDFFDPSVYVEMGNLFMSYHQDELAIEYYTKYLMKHKNDFAIYLKTARLLFHQQMFGEALLFAEKANKLNPHHFKPIEIMLESCTGLKEEELAKTLATEFLKTHPNSSYLQNKLVNE